MINQQEPKPSYYAAIPATVRYDKRITPSAKLLYGEITCLCGKENYCCATNAYFAELYEVSTKSISTWISQLVKLGYIKISRQTFSRSSQKMVFYRNIANLEEKENGR